MVRAAYELFCANGYLGTTISAVAKEAGVAVPTVYYTFGTKAALLDESLGAAIVGFDRWREPPTGPVDIAELLPWHGWWADFEAAPTSAAALDLFVTHGVGILERVGPLVTAMHGATGDTEAAEVVTTAEERRVESYRAVVRIIARKPGGLRPGVTEATATDIVVVLFSAELYQALAVGRGWSHGPLRRPSSGRCSRHSCSVPRRDTGPSAGHPSTLSITLASNRRSWVASPGEKARDANSSFGTCATRSRSAQPSSVSSISTRRSSLASRRRTTSPADSSRLSRGVRVPESRRSRLAELTDGQRLLGPPEREQA